MPLPVSAFGCVDCFDCEERDREEERARPGLLLLLELPDFLRAFALVFRALALPDD
jgi:hypothetical protein